VDLTRELGQDPELHQANEAFCETVHPFDYLECALRRSGRPSRSKVKELHCHWFENGVPLAVDALSQRAAEGPERALASLP